MRESENFHATPVEKLHSLIISKEERNGFHEKVLDLILEQLRQGGIRSKDDLAIIKNTIPPTEREILRDDHLVCLFSIITFGEEGKAKEFTYSFNIKETTDPEFRVNKKEKTIEIPYQKIEASLK